MNDWLFDAQVLQNEETIDFINLCLAVLVFFAVGGILTDIVKPYLWPEEPRVPPVNGDDDEFV